VSLGVKRNPSILNLAMNESSVYSNIRPNGMESRPSPQDSYFTRR